MFKQFRNVPLLIALLLVFLSACQQAPTPTVADPNLPTGWHETEVVLAGFDKPQKVIYESVNGYAMFEGDIILGQVDAQGNLIKSDLQTQSIVRDSGRWSGGIIPFVINSSVAAAGVSNINSAIAHWEANTVIDFIPRTTQTAYVEFVTGTGCSSSVGRQGARQTINLSAACSTGNIIHEIGHAVGLWHEQSREDRNAHVTILTANIQPGREFNFNQQINDATDIGAYDFGSIMHYGAFAFSKNGQPTIVTIPSGIAIGQRNGLSQGDKAAVIRIYPDSLTDLVSYNATTGLAIYSVGTRTPGVQTVVNTVNAAKGWTSIVPMRLNNDTLTDLVSYNATTGLAVYSVGTRTPGVQSVVKTVNAAKGWTSIVPMNLNNDNLTDLVSYNATTGLAVYSVGTTTPGVQSVVKTVNAAKGWTSIVPMSLNSDALTDLVSYNATTGLAIYSVGTITPGEQVIVNTVNAAKGWTSIVPMRLNNDFLTDLVSYNATTGLAIYSVATSTPGVQSVVNTVNAATGWTSIVPMRLNNDGLTDLVSYNRTTGLAIYSVGASTPGVQSVVNTVNAAKGWSSIVPMYLN
jgi:Astacin (Peptidase family M12A)